MGGRQVRNGFRGRVGTGRVARSEKHRTKCSQKGPEGKGHALSQKANLPRGTFSRSARSAASKKGDGGGDTFPFYDMAQQSGEGGKVEKTGHGHTQQAERTKGERARKLGPSDRQSLL